MRIIRIYLIILTVVGLVLSSPVMAQSSGYKSQVGYTDNDERQNVNVYKIASAAVVTVKSIGGSGAGCIIDPSGIIVTNKHVIGRSYTVSVKLADGNSYNASLIDVDNDDLALLKINASRSFPYIKLGDSSRIEVGQKVLAIGNPFGLERTLTTGIISRIDYDYNRIQTDAAINPGNSGGPLLNTKGELIGINQAIMNPSGRSSAGIGFAIPSNTVKRLLALSRNAKIHTVPKNSLALTPNRITQRLPSVVYDNKVFLGIAGKKLSGGQVIILGVAPGSPAEAAGLRYKDIVLAVDTVQIKNFDDIGFALKDKKPGDRVNLLYMRNGVVNNASTVLVPRN